MSAVFMRLAAHQNLDNIGWTLYYIVLENNGFIRSLEHDFG